MIEEQGLSGRRGRGWGPGRGRGQGWGHRGGQGRGGWGAPLEPAILAALATSPRHGYDLRAAVEEMTSALVSADPGGLYRLLRRLEDDGLVTSFWADGAHGPQRRQYQLTPEGRETLAHWHEPLRERATALRSIADAISAVLSPDPHAQDDSTTAELEQTEKTQKRKDQNNA